MAAKVHRLATPGGLRPALIPGTAGAAVGRVNERVQLLGEVYGNSSATAGSETADTAGSVPRGEGTGLTAELTRSEIVASFGVGGNVRPKASLYRSVDYDNRHAVQARFGFTFTFK